MSLGLIGAAGVVAFTGARLRRPLTTTWPGKRAATFMVVGWVFALSAFLAGLGVYAAQEVHDFPGMPPLTDHILPITLAAAVVTIGVIVFGSAAPARVRLTSAVIGAMAAPMIFELPFDMIVLSRTYPSLPPDPALYRVVFFAPLFLLELTTIALLTLTPMVRVTSVAFYGFALMLVVFAIWAATIGFHYPSTAAPIALNIVSKLLAFATTLALFFPGRLSRRPRTTSAAPAG